MSEQHTLCQETSQGDAPPSWSPLLTTLSAATGHGQGADPWGQAGGPQLNHRPEAPRLTLELGAGSQQVT